MSNLMAMLLKMQSSVQIAKVTKGNELHVGDYVVYVRGKNASAELATGHVTKIYENNKECSVDGYAHVYDFRVMKLIQEE